MRVGVPRNRRERLAKVPHTLRGFSTTGWPIPDHPWRHPGYRAMRKTKWSGCTDRVAGSGKGSFLANQPTCACPLRAREGSPNLLIGTPAPPRARMFQRGTGDPDRSTWHPFYLLDPINRRVASIEVRPQGDSRPHPSERNFFPRAQADLPGHLLVVISFCPLIYPIES